MAQKLSETAYIREVSNFIKRVTGYNISLSATDKQILKECIKKEIPIETLKELIRKEASRYPPEKRKKMNLSFLREYIKKPVKPKEETLKTVNTLQKNWQEIVYRLNIPEEVLNIENIPEELQEIAIETKVINYLWKQMPTEEKKALQQKAIEKLKKEFILTNIEVEKVLKSIIRQLIKEKYNI